MQGAAEGGALIVLLKPYGVPDVAFEIYLVLVALLIGSFINLAVDRLPRGESVVTPRSHCRGCGRVLSVVDLLPVAGYLIRCGRCASCGTEIGFMSPLIEGAAGVLMVFALVVAGLGSGWIIGLLLILLFAVTAVCAAYWRAGVSSGSRPDRGSVPSRHAR